MLPQADELDLRAQVEQQILDHYLEIDDDGNFLHPPGSDDELDEFVQIAFKMKIPRQRTEVGHKAPFEFVADLFFERIKNALGFANRNGGKTMNVAILNLLDLLFKGKCEVASAGAVLDQASKCYRYFCDFLELPWFKKFRAEYQKKTGQDFLEKSIQSYTRFNNGSILEILTGTEKGLRSPHPHKARIDEIDLMEWSVLQTGLSMAHSSETIRGQNVFTSTRQRSNGPMQRLLDEAPAKGIEIYEWNVWEMLEKCPRRCFADEVFGDCPVYCFCEGKAHHCDGFYKIDDFIDKVRLLDRDTWDTEWLNKKPSRHKMVYAVFDNTRHIMTPERLKGMTGQLQPRGDWFRVTSIDFGSSPGHAFVYLKFCQLPNGAWLQYFEYVADQRLLRDHADAIQRSPFYLRSDLLFADWDAQDRLELRSYGIQCRPAAKPVLMGIDYVKTLLSGFPPKEEPMLYIWYDCPITISEYGSYRWPSRPDGAVDRSGNPLKDCDDTMDATRYALFSFKHVVRGPKYRTYSVPGI